MKIKPLKFLGEASFVDHRRSAKRSEGSGFTAFVLPSNDGHWYFAAVASKRLGGAVVRNRAKRRLREAFAAVTPGIQKPHRVILYAKSGALKKGFKELVEGIKKTLG